MLSFKLKDIMALGPESGPESMARRILKALSIKDRSRSEIASELGHKSISSKLKMRIHELLEDALIGYTIPDKPNSRLQKYRITAKGKKTLRQGGAEGPRSVARGPGAEGRARMRPPMKKSPNAATLRDSRDSIAIGSILLY